MRKNTNNRNKKSELCPLLQEGCKNSECMWYHQQFEKCHLEIVGYNLFILSKSVDKILKQ